MSKSNSDELDRILWGLTDQSAWDLSGITQKQSDDLSETLSADRIEAKELIEAGCDLVTIKELMGHEDINTTMQYLRVTNKFVKKEYKKHFGQSYLA
jgi:site-specific recombinase XerD